MTWDDAAVLVVVEDRKNLDERNYSTPEGVSTIEEALMIKYSAIGRISTPSNPSMTSSPRR